MSSTLPEPGSKLPNGATVVLSLPHPTDPHVCYVGATVEGFHPYATWACNVDGLATYWGHYSGTAEDMLDDLRARASAYVARRGFGGSE